MCCNVIKLLDLNDDFLPMYFSSIPSVGCLGVSEVEEPFYICQGKHFRGCVIPYFTYSLAVIKQE